MTTDEITALRKELEDALMTAFADFKRVTGVAIASIDTQRIHCRTMDKSGFESHITEVNVILEGL